MQCVILAAGKGTRLRPLTDNCPKPLVKVCGKTLLDHIVEALPSAIDQLIIVVGYKGEQIKEHCGEVFHGRPVVYVEQVEQTGTAHALWLTRDLLHNRFLFMFADDIHGAQDLSRAVSYSRSLLVSPVPNPERFGVVVRKPDGTLDLMIEKPKHAPSNYASTGSMVLDTNIFKFTPETPIGDEFYLTEVIERYAQEYPVAIVEQNNWIPVATPEDVANAEKLLCPKIAQSKTI
ncbi:MAG: NDP-sugar pyrophosphorylase family protein [Candidatus Azotimanducaceae bacterium]|jgi:NDP-sugar pyrophosphorylase family protein